MCLAWNSTQHRNDSISVFGTRAESFAARSALLTESWRRPSLAGSKKL